MSVRRTDLAMGVVVGVAALGVGAYALLGGDESSSAPAPAATTATTGAAIAADARGLHPLPVDLFAKAAVDDWHAYRVVRSMPGQTLRSTVLRWIAVARPEVVIVGMRGALDGSADVQALVEDLPRPGLTLERLTGDDRAGWTLSNVVASDDKHTVNGRAFRCTKLTYQSRDPMFPRKQITTELWLSLEVPAGGLVAERSTEKLDGMRFESTKELIGFGTAGATTWGERPTALEPPP